MDRGDLDFSPLRNIATRRDRCRFFGEDLMPGGLGPDGTGIAATPVLHHPSILEVHDARLEQPDQSAVVRGEEHGGAGLMDFLEELEDFHGLLRIQISRRLIGAGSWLRARWPARSPRAPVRLPRDRRGERKRGARGPEANTLNALPDRGNTQPLPQAEMRTLPPCGGDCGSPERCSRPCDGRAGGPAADGPEVDAVHFDASFRTRPAPMRSCNSVVSPAARPTMTNSPD